MSEATSGAGFLPHDTASSHWEKLKYPVRLPKSAPVYHRESTRKRRCPEYREPCGTKGSGGCALTAVQDVRSRIPCSISEECRQSARLVVTQFEVAWPSWP